MRSLKIHQSKRKCHVQLNQQQRATVYPGETQSVQGFDDQHSVQSLQADAQAEPDTHFEGRLNGPQPMTNTLGTNLTWTSARSLIQHREVRCKS